VPPVRDHLRQIGHGLRALAGGDTLAHRLLRRRLLTILVATIALDVLASVAVWLLERHAPGTGFTTLPGALFWTSAQLTTVSSQMPNPITPGAKALDLLLEVWAITAVTSAAGSFGTFFTVRHRHHERVLRGEEPETGAV
jgi:hypothetical protein